MKLYTKNNCPKCDVAKGVIAGNGIDYTKFVEEINIDNDKAAEQVLKDKGISGAPVLETNGTFITEQYKIVQTIIQTAEAQ